MLLTDRSDVALLGGFPDVYLRHHPIHRCQVELDPETLNPKPETLNPKPETLNPKP